MTSHVSGSRTGAAVRSPTRTGSGSGRLVFGGLMLVVGPVITLVGAALFLGATWAGVVGVALVGPAMLANFLWIPYAPFWAIVLIAINAFVIWALCTAPSPSER